MYMQANVVSLLIGPEKSRYGVFVCHEKPKQDETLFINIIMGIRLCIVLLITLDSVAAGVTGNQLQDYCIEDGFYAECPSGELLLMQEAIYGRMEFGTCLKYGLEVTCQSDVLQYMDSWCSGLRQCEVELFNFIIMTSDCPAGLYGFLRARYTCVKVVNLVERCCPLLKNQTQVPVRRNYIAATVTTEYECSRDRDCPIAFQALEGQNINISLYSFQMPLMAAITNNSDVSSHQGSPCFVNVSIREEGIGVRVALCDDDTRKRHIYTSSTNKLEVRVVSAFGTTSLRFVFILEAIGCPNPIPPAHGYVERFGDHAFIKCNGSNMLSWDIFCRENNWHGIYGNCSEDTVFIADNNIGENEGTHVDPALVIALIIFLAVTISVIIIIVGIICVRRNRHDGEPCRRLYPFNRGFTQDHGKSCLDLDISNETALGVTRDVNSFSTKEFENKMDTVAGYSNHSPIDLNNTSNSKQANIPTSPLQTPGGSIYCH